MRSGTSSAAKMAPMRNVSQRPQPTFGADEPDEHATDGGEDEQVEVLGVAKHPPGVVDRPGHRQADQEHAGERQPALGRCERECGASSGEDLAERPARGDDVGAQLVLGEGMAEGTGRAWRRARPLRRSTGAGSPLAAASGIDRELVVGRAVEGDHDAGDAARSERRERPDPGRVERGA